jgi:hypothetical protein
MSPIDEELQSMCLRRYLVLFLFLWYNQPSNPEQTAISDYDPNVV